MAVLEGRVQGVEILGLEGVLVEWRAVAGGVVGWETALEAAAETTGERSSQARAANGGTGRFRLLRLLDGY